MLLILSLVYVKRIRRQGESKISLCNPSAGRLRFRPSLSYNKLFNCAESHLESCQTSVM